MEKIIRGVEGITMPYKATNKTVLVRRRGRWVTFKRHKTPAAAQRQAAALNAKGAK